MQVHKKMTVPFKAAVNGAKRTFSAVKFKKAFKSVSADITMAVKTDKSVFSFEIFQVLRLILQMCDM